MASSVSRFLCRPLAAVNTAKSPMIPLPPTNQQVLGISLDLLPPSVKPVSPGLLILPHTDLLSSLGRFSLVFLLPPSCLAFTDQLRVFIAEINAMITSWGGKVLFQLTALRSYSVTEGS